MLDQCKFTSGSVILLHSQHEPNKKIKTYRHIGFNFCIQTSFASPSLITVEEAGVQQASKQNQKCFL